MFSPKLCLLGLIMVWAHAGSGNMMGGDMVSANTVAFIRSSARLTSKLPTRKLPSTTDNVSLAELLMKATVFAESCKAPVNLDAKPESDTKDKPNRGNPDDDTPDNDYPSRGNTEKCGNKDMDPSKFICCRNKMHPRAWLGDTECCDQYAYNPKIESCCDGNVNPGFGPKNQQAQCCGDRSYDKRCHSCESKKVKPQFDSKHQTCCDGTIQNLLPKKTCCCGTKVFDPTNLVCCEGKIVDRPADMPGDCCHCGLSLVDIAVVLDSSESITQPNWPKMLAFTQSIFQDADIDNDNVRVGLITYRHNSTLEFHLDDFHKKTPMFNSIKNTKYVRGSTNTASALELMRTDLFDHGKGDRPNVDNVCIIVTDGDSDNFAETIAEARKARNEGIYIFAIGIALKNLTELKNIATPSEGDRNVMSIDDFDHLEDLQGRIFSSICTGTPIITIHKKCGDDFYNPVLEVCCDGKPQPKIAGLDTQCCGKKSYNPKTDICCDDVVNDRKGKNTECCGEVAMNPGQQLCCKNRPVPRGGKDNTECCDIYAYNPKQEVCCNGAVSEAFGNPSKDTSCCDDISYDNRCFQCKNKRVEPMFDPSFQICCDGVIHEMSYGKSCCCGKDIFKPEDSICCDGKLRARTKAEKEHDCCECGDSYVDLVFVLDSSESVGINNWNILLKFVNSIIATSEIDNGKTRVGVETYRHNITEEFYMNTYGTAAEMMEHVKNIPYIRGSTSTGAAIETMFRKMFSRQNGDRNGVPNIAFVILDGTSDEPRRTMEAAEEAKKGGVHIYAVAVGIDMSDELKAIASEPHEENIFHAANFDDLKDMRMQLSNVISDVCPQPPTIRVRVPCGDEGEMYDPKTEVCCNGNPQPFRDNEKTTRCCDQKSYNFKSEMCCADKVSTIPPRAKNPKCCNTKVYDPSKAICCPNNKVVPKSSTKATQCCGLSTYDPISELCCDGGVYTNYGKGKAGDCCLLEGNMTTSFDTRCYECQHGEMLPRYDCAFQRCCDGVIHEVYSPSSCCCGKEVFDPIDEICCNNKIRRRTPNDPVNCCECGKNIIDIIIVLDSSESVGLDNWRKMEVFVEDFVNEADVPSVRFGLLTYKHDVKVEFQLNTYFDKKSILAHVDQLPYIRGSTNTGMALEVMRKMFDARKGDRMSAPNYCLLLTDGRSDDYDYTIQQAQLAKDAGIHIVALGLGLKNITELRNVASAPADENAIPLKNFEELENLKEKIFTELSSTVCSQLPEERCRTPCGNTSIDDQMEICCEGVPQPLVAGKDTMCCKYKAYDPDCFLCCGDNLVPKYAGEFTDCCCHSAYDTRSDVCCGVQIRPKLGGDAFTQCCHNDSYDTRSNVCCGGMYIQPNYGDGNTECCKSESYDNRCYQCTGRIKELYDTDKQMCCDGKIEDKKYDDRSCCCGQKQFDADEGICCGKKLLDRSENSAEVCCNNQAISPLKQICCDGSPQDRLAGLETNCCDKKSYDPSKHHCCDGTLNKKKSKADTCCCGKSVFNVATQLCCDGVVSKLSKPGDRDSSVCCDKRSFDPSREICCDGKVSKLIKGTSTSCCGNKVYDVKTKVCAKGVVKRISPKCAGRKYNPLSQMCCNGWINNATYEAPWARCCYDQAYDARKHVCCCNGHMQEAFAGISTQCCHSFAYDASTHTCCDGHVVEKPYPSADCCCGRQAYDSDRQICCAGIVQPCGEDKSQCCGTQAFDPVLQICCGGNLSDRKYGEKTFCCGTEAYTPSLAVCCGDKIAYTKELNDKW